jgi:hypothetical protein
MSTVGPYTVVPFDEVDGELIVGSTCPFPRTTTACTGFPYTLAGAAYDDVVDDVARGRGYDDYELAAIATVRCAEAAFPGAEYWYQRRADGFITFGVSAPSPDPSSVRFPGDGSAIDVAGQAMETCEEQTGYRELAFEFAETHDQQVDGPSPPPPTG